MVGKSFHLMTNNRGSLGKNIAGFREDNQFCDVTLVCDDGASFKAHRVILASQSDKLRTILTEFQDSQFCLYLAGVDSQQLSSILAFIYSGEARVSQRDLSAFLAAAQTLKIGGLVEDKDDEEVIEDDFKERVTNRSIKSVHDIKDQNNVSVYASETKNIEISSMKYDCTDEVTGDVTDQKEEFDFIEEFSDKTQYDADIPEDIISQSPNPRETKYLIPNDESIKKPKEEAPDDEEEEEEHAWDDAQSVSFEFIKSGKSRGEGILATHDRNYKYHKNNMNLKNTAMYYTCSHKNIKYKNKICKGKAVVQFLQRFDEREGIIVTDYKLVAVSKPEVHSHPPENSTIIAASLVVSMKREIAEDPSVSAREVKEKVLARELHAKFSDDAKIKEVLKLFPKKVENTLNNYKFSLTGKKKKKIHKHSYE